MRGLAYLVHGREPSLPPTWGFVDGLNLQIENPSNADLQENYYNGWKAITCCSSILVWDAEGLIRWCALNYAGSMHDSGICVKAGLYHEIADMPTGIHILCDSAFRNMQGTLVVARSNARLPSEPAERIAWIQRQNATISIRRAVEWGMGTITHTYKRLKTRLEFNPKKRLLLLDTCVRLLNFRTKRVGLNQIRTVFGSLANQEDMGGVENVFGTQFGV